mmetsp:Transcript_6762/g.15478  ORF Transcript_6762/g.15478 Transcript_6762/m.15478 type:complete len:102 (-) Transcript_6762:609-914(-)
MIKERVHAILDTSVHSTDITGFFPLRPSGKAIQEDTPGEKLPVPPSGPRQIVFYSHPLLSTSLVHHGDVMEFGHIWHRYSIRITFRGAYNGSWQTDELITG